MRLGMVCSSLVGAALALAVQPAAAGMLDDPGAPEAPVAASYATIIGGSFEVDGSSSTIPHALTASGSAPPAYSVKTSVKSFSKTLSLHTTCPLLFFNWMPMDKGRGEWFTALANPSSCSE